MSGNKKKNQFLNEICPPLHACAPAPACGNSRGAAAGGAPQGAGVWGVRGPVLDVGVAPGQGRSSLDLVTAALAHGPPAAGP